MEYNDSLKLYAVHLRDGDNHDVSSEGMERKRFCKVGTVHVVARNEYEALGLVLQYWDKVGLRDDQVIAPSQCDATEVDLFQDNYELRIVQTGQEPDA